MDHFVGHTRCTTGDGESGRHAFHNNRFVKPGDERQAVRRSAPYLVGFDRATRLPHPGRHLPALSPQADAPFVEIRLGADAVLDLLLQGIRHSRDDGDAPARPPGFAWLRPASSRSRQATLSARQEARIRQYADPDHLVISTPRRFGVHRCRSGFSALHDLVLTISSLPSQPRRAWSTPKRI